jgi:hypothetical protein
VRQWLIKNDKLGGVGGFCLLAPYPRRRFGQDTMTSTLKDLQLAPKAVLIVHPETP